MPKLAPICQDATKEKDAVFVELDDWMSEFYAQPKTNEIEINFPDIRKEYKITNIQY